jgi:hypothetical protein
MDDNELADGAYEARAKLLIRDLAIVVIPAFVISCAVIAYFIIAI